MGRCSEIDPLRLPRSLSRLLEYHFLGTLDLLLLDVSSLFLSSTAFMAAPPSLPPYHSPASSPSNTHK